MRPVERGQHLACWMSHMLGQRRTRWKAQVGQEPQRHPVFGDARGWKVSGPDRPYADNAEAKADSSLYNAGNGLT
ncbi:MAG: hypothetical protein KatS3mg054_1192 [Chloroflexus sp.]|nr:MAG: hypothetical protein KatS3mg054_1192 [Chloroflexus sp.]